MTAFGGKSLVVILVIWDSSRVFNYEVSNKVKWELISGHCLVAKARFLFFNKTQSRAVTGLLGHLPGTSFPVSETCRGLLVVLIFQRVIFSFGGIWNRVFTLTNTARWIIWRRSSVRKLVRSIVSCWPMSWTILKKSLKTTSKKTVGILPISLLKLNHLVWHVLSFNFV